MPYRINPETDRPYIEEFRRNPIGHHSPGLMRVLNALRYDSGPTKPVLIVRKPFEEWVIGAVPLDRSQPIVAETDRVFISREEAEWVMFCRRWEAHTGERINMPFRVDEDAEGSE